MIHVNGIRKYQYLYATIAIIVIGIQWTVPIHTNLDILALVCSVVPWILATAFYAHIILVTRDLCYKERFEKLVFYCFIAACIPPTFFLIFVLNRYFGSGGVGIGVLACGVPIFVTFGRLKTGIANWFIVRPVPR